MILAWQKVALNGPCGRPSALFVSTFLAAVCWCDLPYIVKTQLLVISRHFASVGFAKIISFMVEAAPMRLCESDSSSDLIERLWRKSYSVRSS